MEEAALVEAWRSIVRSGFPWVLFANGTCVFLREPHGDLAQQATGLLRVWGTVHPGSPAGDVGSHELPDGRGWVVSGHHADILTYVAPDEVTLDDSSDLMVGLVGRSKRGRDAEELRVIHIADRPAPRAE